MQMRDLSLADLLQLGMWSQKRMHKINENIEVTSPNALNEIYTGDQVLIRSVKLKRFTIGALHA